MSDKPKYPRALAIEVARQIVGLMTPYCEQLIVAGSLRRRKKEVGDVEILFVPRTEPVQVSLFETGERSLVEPVIALMLSKGLIEKRTNVNGSEMWGEKNRLARHMTGVPVDLFAATADNWWNYLVCRTGGSETNVCICNGAIAKGWKWNPYGEGFSRARGLGRESHAVQSEREVFEFAGLEYLEPWERK